MLIKTLPVGQLETNCYIVSDPDTHECAVIDPGAEANTILGYIEAHTLKVRVILITHGHFDHTTSAANIGKSTGAKIYINEKDASSVIGSHAFRPDNSTEYYGEGDTVTMGPLVFEIMETPGHSEGSVTIKCQNALFTGDTLFKDSCGRTDLPGGNMDILLQSLRRLYNLAGDFEVYPGHMESTTLDRERRQNYYMKYAVNSK